MLALVVVGHHLTSIKVGTAAVAVFFVLSGYWISVMWDGRYSRTRQPYLTYIVSRAWRLLPTFWMSSALTWLILGRPDYFTTAPRVLSSLVLFGYARLDDLLVAPAWSLDIEMQFYVVAPLLLALLAKAPGAARAMLAGVALLSLGSLFLLGEETLPSLAVYFMIGVAAARLNWRPSGRLAAASLIATAALVVGLAASPWRDALLGGAHPRPLTPYNEPLNLLLALLVAPYALFTTRQASGRLDKVFADLSYTIYLIHWAAVAWLAQHAAGLAFGPRLLVSVAISVAVLALGALLWWAWDRPINRFRAHWVVSRLRRNEASEAAVAGEIAGP
jgi:peptidoglycan/LPS O-acetylase OafA/YrhL